MDKVSFINLTEENKRKANELLARLIKKYLANE